MTDAGLRTVRFVSEALPDDSFDLLDLHGLEELNRLFSFHLRLAVREPARVRGQTQALLEAPAFLLFFDDGQEVRRVHGVLAELALDLDVELDQAELSVTLVPRLWALTLTAKGKVSILSDGDVEITAAGSLSIKAASVSIESDGTLTLQGASVLVKGPTTVNGDLTVAGSVSGG